MSTGPVRSTTFVSSTLVPSTLVLASPVAMGPTALRRRGLRPAALAGLLGALVLGLLLAPGAVPSASAHDSLTGSQPAAGESLEAPPTEVLLEFSADVQEIGTAVELRGPDGAVGDETPTVQGRDVVLPVPADLPGGEYEVVYRVTSSDGHPISGSVPFSVTTPAVAPSTTQAPTTQAPEPAAPDPSTPDPSTPDLSTTEAPTSTTAPSQAPSSVDASPTAASDDGGSGVPLAVTGAVVVLALVVALVLVLRRRGGQHR